MEPGQKLKIEKLSKDEGEVNFNKVLLLEKNRKLEIGAPSVKGARVTAKIISQGKAKKVIVFRYKAKKRMKRKKGHRQPFTEVEILKIEVAA